MRLPSPPSLHRALMTALAVGLAVTPLGSPASAGSGPAGGAIASSSGSYQHRFVAAPDFLNQDLGDVSRLPGWHPGDANSWTPQLQQSVDTFLDEVAATQPESVLVPGDLVEGHWLRDVDHTGLFGPSGRRRDLPGLIRHAGDFYEGLWAERFAQRGLTFHAAVGDHDIGDNDWTRAAKRDNVDVYRDVFADHFTTLANGKPRYGSHPVGTPYDRTAYSVRLAPEVLLVTIDVFHRRDGDLHSEVVGGQLRWLRKVLAKAKAQGIDWVIVQGHDPVIPRVRMRSSSGMLVEKGVHSKLWRVLRRGGVDLYLCGEVHNTSSAVDHGVLQVATGGLLWAGFPTYMTIDVTPEAMTLTAHDFSSMRVGARSTPLWQFGTYRTSGSRALGTSHVAGTLTLGADGSISDTSGKLVPLS